MRLMILLAMFLVVPCIEAASLSGRVLSAHDLQPIAGAAVQLSSSNGFYYTTEGTDESDARGQFSIETNSTLYLRLLVDHPDYALASVTGSLADLQSTEVLLTLAGSLRVQIIAEDTGEPIAGALVDIGQGHRIADSSGEVAFPRIRIGDYPICAFQRSGEHLSACLDGSFPGFVEQVSGPAIVVAAGEESVAVIAAPRGGAIDGDVEDGFAGGILPNTTLSYDLFSPDGTLLRRGSVDTDAQGKYRVPRLPSGNYLLSMKTNVFPLPYFAEQIFPMLSCKSGCPFAQAEAIAIVQPAVTAGVDFSLLALGVVSGRLIDAVTGAPIDGMEVAVYVFDMTQPRPYYRSRTDADGTFEVGYLPAGRQLYVAAHGRDGYPDTAWPNLSCTYPRCGVGEGFVLQAEDVRDGFNFELAQGAAIRGRITERGSSKPLVAQVSIYTGSGTVVWTGASDADGFYSSSSLASGTYWVLAKQVEPYATCSVHPADSCTAGGLVDFSTAPGVAFGGAFDVEGVDVAVATRFVHADGFEAGD